jgi:ubiquinone/menaquinone biosynthesis C-methylase UbiE
MPDVYAAIAEAEPTVVERLAQAMEIRAAEREQRAMLETYLAEIALPPAARVLEIGCGTGAVTRVLARWPGVAEVAGVDPSPIFLAKARELAAGIDNVAYHEADGRSLPFDGGSFDGVVIHTVLSHVPGPERVLAEAGRVLRPGGWLAVFDGDYATTTLAIGDWDPVQACADMAMAALVNDRWLVRRLPALVQSAGFDRVRFRSHGYAQTATPSYTLTLVDRGADALAAAGRIGPELAAALKAEARRRVERGAFFGFIAYASLTARRPA